MKTKKAVETHNSIIKAAELLFMEKSVSKVTVNDIVKKAGVAKGTFYLYFESKDDLVWHFLEHQLGYANKWVKEIARYGYEEEDIEAIISFIIRFTKRHLPMLKMIHNVRFYSFLGSDKMEKKYTEQWINPMMMWLEKGRLQGAIQIEDARFTAYYLVHSVHDMIDRSINEEVPYSIDELGENLGFLLKKLLK